MNKTYVFAVYYSSDKNITKACYSPQYNRKILWLPAKISDCTFTAGEIILKLLSVQYEVFKHPSAVNLHIINHLLAGFFLAAVADNRIIYCECIASVAV